MTDVGVGDGVVVSIEGAVVLVGGTVGAREETGVAVVCNV